MTGQPSSPRQPFNKPWLSCQDQVALLRQRGLVIADGHLAVAFLSHVNYYRFSGYCLAFEQARHRFRPNVTFEQVYAAYEFDRQLRDLVTDALELVELDFRTAIAQHFGKQYGAFGHTDTGKFFHRFDHRAWMEKLHEEACRSKELFITHYRATYDEFPDLPIWMATEVMSFGALSQMFKGMNRPDQKAIAGRYACQPGNLVSWMHHLAYVRNLCAHHARLWDRIWSIKPTLPAGQAWQPPTLPGSDRLFVTLLILRTLLRKCPTMMAFGEQWRGRVADLLDRPPDAPDALALMGLRADWKSHSCWK